MIDAVKGFGRRLGVEPEHIRAVELEYNELSGRWWDYAEPQAQQSQTYLDFNKSPLTISSGKSAIIRELAGALPGRRMMVGDGSSDLAATGEVDLFVGYGGVVARERVKAGSDLFLQSASLAPVLPMAAGRRGWETLRGTAHESLFRKGLSLARGGESLHFGVEKLQDRFIREFEDIF